MDKRNFSNRIKVLILLFFLPALLFSQSQKIKDSLLSIIHSAVNDTSKVRAFCALCWELRESDSAGSRQFGKEGAELAEKAGFNSGKAQCLSNIGLGFFSRADYSNAIVYFLRSLEFRKKAGDKRRVAECQNKIGDSYCKIGKYDESIKYFFESQKNWEELNDYEGRIGTFIDIANVYYLDENLESAVRYASEALKLAEEKKDTSYLGICFANIGLMYSEKKEYDKALSYLEDAMKINEKLNDITSLEQNFTNIGLLYFREKKYKDALKYYEKALPLTKKVDQEHVAIVLNNIGEVYLMDGNYAQAAAYCKQSLDIAKNEKRNDDIKDAKFNLAKAFAGMKNFPLAYENLFDYSSLKDSIFKNESQKSIAEMQARYDVDKKEKENQLLGQQLDMQALHTEQQKIIIYSVSIVAVLLLFFAFFIFRGLRQKQKANTIIAMQKQIVEDRNKDITDSINYAKKIQDAILPDSSEFQILFPGSFILFKPKDIVSGDFYWISTKGEYTFITTADCTGHGVPGGFMSTLGNSLLNEIVNEKNILEPADILDLLRVKIIAALRQKGESGENKDGMDMCLCRFNSTNSELTYAAANNPLWIVRNDKLLEFPADKQPVGISGVEMKQFNQHSIILKKGDTIYTFTDGYADQFGGPKGKKFKYKQLQETLVSISSAEMEEQKKLLDKKIEDWKGNLEQVDDILLIGINI